MVGLLLVNRIYRLRKIVFNWQIIDLSIQNFMVNSLSMRCQLLAKRCLS